MRLAYMAFCLFLLNLPLAAQTVPISTTEPDSYVSLTADELEAILMRVAALRRQQLWIQQQRQRQFINRQAPDNQQPQAATPTGNPDTDRRIAELEQQLRQLRQPQPNNNTAPPNSFTGSPASSTSAGTTDPRVDVLLAEVRRLESALADERRRLDRVEEEERERIAFELDSRQARAQNDYDLDRLRQEGRLSDQEYRYERRLLRERQRLAELENERRERQTTIVNTPVAPTTNPQRPNIIPLPYATPGGRDTVVIVQPGMTTNNDAALRAEIDQLRRTVAELRNAPAAPVPPAPVYTAPAAPVRTAVVRDFPAVLFDNASAVIAPNYQSVIRAVAEAYRKGRVGEIQVTGYASPTGSAALNQRLSEQRAEAVRAALVGQGVPAELIEPIYGGINYEYNQLAAARRVNIRVIGN